VAGGSFFDELFPLWALLVLFSVFWYFFGVFLLFDPKGIYTKEAISSKVLFANLVRELMSSQKNDILGNWRARFGF